VRGKPTGKADLLAEEAAALLAPLAPPK
jgi:hypothetical protein